jgi:hypothetical protein
MWAKLDAVEFKAPGLGERRKHAHNEVAVLVIVETGWLDRPTEYEGLKLMQYAFTDREG